MIDIIEWLRNNTVFSSLSTADLLDMQSGLCWRDFLGQALVCREGDATNSLYIIVSGRLEVFKTEADGAERVVGEVGSGELFGEIALVTGEVRSASARAIRDTTALELDESTFARLLLTNPSLIRNITRIIVHRLRAGTKPRPRDRAQTIAVLPIAPRLATARVVERLTAAMSEQIPTTIVDRAAVERSFGAGSTDAEWKSDKDREVVGWLNSLERDVDCLVYVCDDDASDQRSKSDAPPNENQAQESTAREPSSWTQRCLRQADRILLVADVEGDPAPTRLEHQLFVEEGLSKQVPKQLVLLYEDRSKLIGRALQWASGRELAGHDFVNLENPEDWARLTGPLAEASIGPNWLRQSVLFSGLEVDGLRSVMTELSWLDLKGQEDLFKQGDKGDSLYLIVSGRLQAIITKADGSELAVGEMGPGEIIGEIALVTGEDRSATIRAVRDSKVVQLSKSSFDRLAASRPDLVFQLSRVIVDRLSGRRQMARTPRSVNFAVLFLDEPSHAAMKFLEGGFSRLGHAMTLSAAVVERGLGEGTAQLRPGDVGDSMLVEWLNNYESKHDYLLYQCDASASPWTLRCLRQADRILLVASANGRSELSSIEREVFQKLEMDGTSKARTAVGNVPRYLLLIQEEYASEGRNTKNWLDARSVTGHYHLRDKYRPDFSRVARHLTNQAVGLVLGGGGSRGVAHVGVYRALLDAGIYVDTVSGTSAGAGIAGLIAMGDAPSVMIEKVTDMLTRPIGHFLTFGPPFASMMSGRHPHRLLTPWFEQSQIEDQFIPCAIVAADLVSGELVVHRNGSLLEAVRASSSLPAAWPPVVNDSGVLVDGGVLNNLPIDLVKKACANGATIASDISAEADYSGFDKYGVHLSGWSILSDKLNPFRRRRKLPSIMGVIARCCTLASLSKAQELLKDKQVLYLQPPVSGYGMFDIRTEPVVRELESLCYEYTREQLAKWPRYTERNLRR